MARMTFEEARATNPWGSDLLAVLVSGKNPDGTDFTLPTVAAAAQAPPEMEEFRVRARAVLAVGVENGPEFINTRHRGMRLYARVYAAPAGVGPTLDIKIQTRDPESLDWADMASAALPQISAAGLSTLVVYPGINQSTVGTAARASNILSRRWRIVSTVGGSGSSFDFSVGGLLIP